MKSKTLPGVLMALFLLVPLLSRSQQLRQLAGTVNDGKDSTALPGAVVMVVNAADTTNKRGVTTSQDGLFLLNALPEGRYQLTVSFLGYKTATRSITIAKQNLVLPAIFLSSDAKQLSEVSVVGLATPMQIKGDTVEYNADAFKVNADASAEDLVKKMPGVTTEGNTVKVNGEEVKKILVDGKPFFSDDPTATLRNLPADVVGNMQVFDKQTDQAEFTGFKDGNAEKTINLKTKKGMNVGDFGKVYGGYGTDGKYNGGITLNHFNGSRRISLIGMSNNINQQNFAIADIMSLMSNAGTQPGPPGSGSGADFFTGQQNGITTTHAVGLNYNDSWGKKINVSGSYFLNYTDNQNASSILRNYYTNDHLRYRQNSNGETKNLNHKVNLKLEYLIDSLNKLTVTPRFTFQTNKSATHLAGNTSADDRDLSTLANDTRYTASAYNFNNDVLWQHKFRKNKRTFSLNVNTQFNTSSGDGSYYSSTLYNDTLFQNDITDQKYTTNGSSRTVGANLSYTEPAGKNGLWLFSYKPSVTKNDGDRIVNNPGADGGYTQNDLLLSNTFESQYSVQQGGLNYSLNKGRGVFTLGVDAQQANLTARQTYPQTLLRDQSFFTLLPSASYTYKSPSNFNMNLNYRTSTKAPGISQLQNLVDRSNSLFVRSGNPDLKQSMEQGLVLRLMKRLPEKEKHVIVFIKATQTNNYIGNSTSILNSDTVIQNVNLERGSQFSRPVNLNNYYTITSFGAFGFPIRAIKSNFNINAGYGLTQTPALINNRLNYALNNAFKGGFYLSSNVSQQLDFSLAYNGSYNTVSNSLQTQSNSTYLNHSFTAKANYLLFNRLVLNSDITQYTYTGLASGFNQSYTLWNASIAYKLLKNRALEMKLSAYDLLNQNRSISRTLTETYTEDSQTKVLNRYFLLTFTYTFKRFKNNAVGPQEMKLPKGLPPPENMPHPPMDK